MPSPRPLDAIHNFGIFIRGTIMRMQRYSIILGLVTGLLGAAAPAWGVNRDVIQLQTQVQTLQDQMTHMQQAFDERIGVMKNLVEKDTDAINKATAALNNLQTTLEKQQSDSGTHVDQLSGQIQSLNDSLDELKARLTKVSKQLEDMQAVQQNLATQPGAQTQLQQPAAAQAPPPDVLYNNALTDYDANKIDLATQEFAQFVKAYPDIDLTGNSYFYLAEIAFRQGNFQEAAKNYDLVLQNFPSGNKAASAQLKKGFSLIELGQKENGIAELRHVIQRYPKSNEALQARERLHKLGVATTGTAAARRPS
jgi:tol-pal system protein YbgF